MTRVHICLVSGQPIPNLIPLKMEELRPEKVILLVSPDMAVPAARMKKVISAWGMEVEEKPIEPYNLNTARQTCLDLLVELEDKDVVLNATGGTKIMAFAAFEVFREMQKPILYVNTQNKRIQALSPEDCPVAFRGLIKVRPYLAAYGQNIVEDHTNQEIMKGRQELTDLLVREAARYEKALSNLNKYASRERDTRIFPVQTTVDDRDYSTPNLMELLGVFEKFGLLSSRPGAIEFRTASDAEYVSGGWLEEYVYRTALSVSPTDVRRGVKVLWDEKGAKPPENEYDVVFTSNNQLFLIECKTKRFEGADRQNSNSDPIYKLNSLRDAAGGVYGKGMFVSYKRLTDVMRQRLSANKLTYCDGPALRNLREKVMDWIR